MGTLGCVLLAFLCPACGRQPAAEAQSDALHVQIGTALPRRGVPGVGVRELVLALVGETIFAVDRNGRLIPRLCDSWDWQGNGRLLKLTLKQGIRFHDGSELSATLAADLLRREFATNKALSYGSVTSVEAIDPQTVHIRLKRREAFLPEDLTYSWLTKGTTGTGPFVLEGAMPEGEPSTAASLHAFESYHMGAPEVKRIDVKAYPTLRGAWTAMMRGDINMLHEVSREATAFVKQESSVQSYAFLRPYTLLLAFNMRHPVLGRHGVRQALSLAVDRPAIVRDGMAGQGEPADGPIWKYHWAYSTASRTYDFNPEAARLRLDAAGFRQGRESGGRMPSRFSFRCLMFGDDPRFERAALVLQKQLYDIGVDMQIEAVPVTELVDRMAAGRFDAFFFEMISSRSLTWMYRIWHSQSSARWFNSGHTAADAALDRLREVFSEADTRAAVSELQRVLYEDPPALFLAWPTTTRAVSASIVVPYEPNIDIFGRVWRFRRAATDQARQ